MIAFSHRGNVDKLVDEVVAQARSLIPGCEAGVLLSSGDHPATTGLLARAGHEAQRLVDEGPSLAVLGDGQPRTCADAGTDGRWPGFAAQAARLGIAAVLAVPLAGSHGCVGVLDCYSRDAGAFDDDAEAVARAFAIHAGIAIEHADEVAQLKSGIAARGEIGQAIGLLIGRYDLSADEAFSVLIGLARRDQRKVREIAAEIIRLGGDSAALAALEHGRTRRTTHMPRTPQRPDAPATGGPQELRISVPKPIPGGCALALSGELDLASAAKLVEELDRRVLAGDLIIRIDTAQLRFCDCAGLAVFIRTHEKLLARQGRLTLVNVPELLARMLAITGLDHLRA